MVDNKAENIVDIEPFSFKNQIGNTFLNVFMYMFFAFIISIIIAGNESNQVSILIFFTCVTFVLFALNVVSDFRKPFTYIYSISTSNKTVEIKFLKLFSNHVIEVNVKDVNVVLENEGNKNVCLIINGFNKKTNFSIKQTIIWQWKTKRIRETYDLLNTIVSSKSNL